MKLIQGDCMKEMSNILDNSVDMVLADPPYGINKASWDAFLPLDWVAFALKVLKSTGAMYIFGDPLKLTELQTVWTLRGVNWASRTTWTYEDGPRSKKAWTKKHEDCLCFYGKHHVQKTPKEPSIHKDKRWGDDRLIGSVWKRPRVLGNYKERTLHPTQKPESLIEIPIMANTNEGDIVLDPFMGSGTTGVVCKRLNRDFIGIEMNKEYFEMAKKRIEGTQYNQCIDRTKAAHD